MDNNCINNDTRIKKIIDAAKQVLIWSKKYWDRSHQFGEQEYTVQDINEAFNKWNWAEKDLKELIIAFEDEQRKQEKHDDNLFIFDKNNKGKTIDEMLEEKKQFTKITCETSYGEKMTLEWDTEDLSPDDYMHAFYTIMVGQTFMPKTILEAMYEYAHDALKNIEPEYLDEQK